MKATIEQLKKDKKAVEEKISAIVNQFAQEYNLESISIDYERALFQESRNRNGELVSTIHEIKISLKIGL